LNGTVVICLEWVSPKTLNVWSLGHLQSGTPVAQLL